MTNFCMEGRTARRLRAWIAAAAAALFAWDALPAHAFLTRPALFAAIGSATKAPNGWLQLCAANADECKPSADQARDVTLTPELLQQLYEINKYVNDRVTWTSDAELYGKTERWAYPLDRGDCEDMVLLKRKLLAKAGWPQGALLITIVEERGQTRTRHAVLTVRSDRGEMILDNQTPEICSGTRRLSIPVAPERDGSERLGIVRCRAGQTGR
ncbi:transglutaminase-like cysteine peptidase [Bradyrhizobium sp. B117]|uniref:transglutaminase-like cysteine peptidase n=1 Tax=Bradyrhizobium sp. B117 TaxID=3140246 RepID=UPI0031831FB1